MIETPDSHITIPMSLSNKEVAFYVKYLGQNRSQAINDISVTFNIQPPKGVGKLKAYNERKVFVKNITNIISELNDAQIKAIIDDEKGVPWIKEVAARFVGGPPERVRYAK